MSKIVLISLFDEWCLGLRSLQAHLKRAGHSVSLVMLKAMEDIGASGNAQDDAGYYIPPAAVTETELKLLFDFLAREKPLLAGLGFSSNFSGLAYRIAAGAREACGARIVFGGIDPTINPEEAADHADFVCVGEGEDFALELVEALEAGKDPGGIANLAWKTNGRFVKNPLRPLIEDLDRLAPPDFDEGDKFLIRDNALLRDAIPPHSALNAAYPTMTARGCPFHCSYCCNSILHGMQNGPIIRRHSVRYVIDELLARKSKQANLSFVEFYDDVFTIQPKWVDEFAPEYRRAIGLPFFCFTHPSVASPTILRQLREAGLFRCVMGLQSGSERILHEVYSRSETREQVIQAVALLDSLGLEIIVDLIGGNPFETEEDRRATLDLLKSLPGKFTVAEIGALSFYDRHPITAMAAEAGIVLEPQIGRHCSLAPATNSDRVWNCLHTLCQFPELSRETLHALADLPALREDPRIIEELTRAIERAHFYGQTRMTKDNVIADMGKQIERLREQVSRAQASPFAKARRWIKRALSGRPTQDRS